MPDRDRAAAAVRYEHLYQRLDSGTQVPWQTGMWFPVMALEEGFPRYKCDPLCHDIDNWMARFMMANQAKWEQRNVG